MIPLPLSESVAVRHSSQLTAYPPFPYGKDSNLYQEVDALLSDLGLDAKNPFGDLLKPGQTVLFKPNWVRDYNPRDPSIDSLITHTAILRPLIDAAITALKGKGTVIVADAPLQGCDFKRLVQVSRIEELLQELRKHHSGITFEAVDLRKTVSKRLSSTEKLKGEQFQFESAGDSRGYTLVDLGEQSLHTDLEEESTRFRVTNYDHRLLKEHHNREKHEYLVATVILQADLVINVPKMKTHIKAGLTGALKNLIGINGHKEYLPHHMNGSFLEGGDQYIYRNRLKDWHNRVYDHYWSRHREQGYLKNKSQSTALLGIAVLNRLLRRENLYDGGWFGNETIPRTTLDLNHILYFYDLKQGKMADQPVRTVLHVMDGIIAGQGNGPLQPEAKEAGILIGGFNPLLVDLVTAKLIGYQPLRIKTIFYGLYHRKSRLCRYLPSIHRFPVIYNGKPAKLEKLPNLKFRIPQFWKPVAAE